MRYIPEQIFNRLSKRAVSKSRLLWNELRMELNPTQLLCKSVVRR